MKDLKSKKISSFKIRKVPTYIQGLDEILEGGLPYNRTTVINGQTGSGKTIFGLEFLYYGALHGEPGIFVGFEETTQQTRENAATLGLNFEELEKQNKLCIIEGFINTDVFISGEFSLKGLLAMVSGKVKEMGAKRIVLDALDVILRLFDNPRDIRKEMHLLDEWMKNSGLTIVMTVRPTKTAVSPFEDFFESLSDCLIYLDARIINQISTRRLRIAKYRGSEFGRNEYPYVITSKGIHLTPITTFGLRHKELGEHITTGNEDLDKHLGGGYRRASCVLIAGVPGVGKTILATTFVNATCKRGEKVLYVSFEESERAIIGNVKSAGLFIDEFTKHNTLSFLCQFPEEMGAEEHFIVLKNKIDEFKPQHIVIDAISATHRMGGKQAAFEYLMRTLNLAKTKGITTLFINQLTGTKEYVEVSGIDISSMIDTTIFLFYVELAGETNRIIQVLKSRGSHHSNQKREYIITDNGIQLKNIYIGEGEVLTGSARLIQEAKDKETLLLLEYQIREKELELERLKLLKNQNEINLRQRAGERGASSPNDENSLNNKG